jgi:hypothetical protein
MWTGFSWPVVSTMMKLQVPLNTRDVLTNSVTGIISPGTYSLELVKDTGHCGNHPRDTFGSPACLGFHASYVIGPFHL